MPTALARLTILMLMLLLLRFALPTHSCSTVIASTVIAGGVAIRRGAGRGFGRGFADGVGSVVDTANYFLIPCQGLPRNERMAPGVEH